MAFTLGMVSSIVLARTLKPNNLGIFHEIQWVAGLASTIISFGFITSIVKFTATYKAKGEQKNMLSMIRYIVHIELFITLISTAFLLFFSTAIADFYFSPKESKLFMIAFIAITPGMQTAIFSALLEGVQVFKYQGIHSLTITPASLLTKIILMLNGYGIESLLWCNLAFSLINLLFYLWASKQENLLKNWFKTEKFSGSEKQKFLSYNYSVFSIHLIDQVVWNRSENFFLGRYCQAAQIAYYNLAHNLVSRLTGIIPMLMWKILLPLLSENEAKGTFKDRQKIYYFSMRYSAFILFPVITISILCAYEIIVILYGQEYAGAEACFQLLCLGALFSSLSQPGSAVIYAANKQKFIFWYGSVLAVINLGLNMLLIPHFKAQGAAMCYSIVTIAGSLGGLYYISKYIKLKIPVISLMKISFSCICLLFIVYLLIRQDIRFFDIFIQFRGWCNSQGYTLIARIVHPRNIRLAFSIASGLCFYLFISIILFKPTKDDFKILLAFQKYLPNPLLQGIIRLKGKI